MKKRSIFILCLVFALLLGACGAGGTGDTTPGTQATQPAPTTEPEFTIESIRTAEFTDIPAYSLYYDLACYMDYYKLMDAPEGTFGLYQPVSREAAAKVMEALSGKTRQQELTDPAEHLTRAQLLVMLRETAKDMGLPASAACGGVTYSDVNFTEGDAPWKVAALWAAEKGLFRCFTADKLLPNTVVSRLQLAQAVLALKTLDEKDGLAKEIYSALPARSGKSASRDNHEALQAVVDATAKKYGAEGLQVAVVEKGVVTDTFAYGWATKNTDPMTADHKIRIASISKVAVGLTAQLLREDGIIDLDQDISDYWGVKVKNPKYPTIPITIRGMLTHTSSIVNAGDGTSRAYNSVKNKLQGSGFSGGVPGDIGYWVYNNYGFAVLGMTLELASNRLVDDILQEKLYKAMDIDAAFGSGDIQNTQLLATLYRANGEVARTVEAQKKLHSDPKPGGSGSYFAGGMTASAYDLGKLLALLAGDGKYEGVQLLQAESVAQMESYIEPAVPGGSFQALPMRYWPELYGRKGIFFHTGSAYGVFNCFCYDPETGDGVVVLTTGASGAKDDYGIYKVAAEINAEIYNVIQ